MGEGVFLGQLQAFIEVARLGNVTRAADALFLTQPALSSRLQRLEREVGGPLLIRDHKGARLTDAGQAFLPYAERAVAIMTEAHRVVGDIKHGLTEELVVATTHTLAVHVLPPVIIRFVTANPLVRLSVRTALSEDILEMVLRGDAQLGLGRSLQHPAIESLPLYEEEYVLVVGAHHPLAEIEHITVADLAQTTILTLFRSETYRLYIRNLFSRDGTEPQNIIDVDNPGTGKRILQESFGVGLIPHAAVQRELEDGSLKQLQLPEMKHLRRSMVALRLQNTTELSSVRNFLSLLSEQLQDMGLVSHTPRRRESGSTPSRRRTPR